jgi:hypothetical protein
MPGENFDALTSLEIPEPDGRIETAGQRTVVA